MSPPRLRRFGAVLALAAGLATHTHTHTHTHTSSQEVRSGKFEMYDYGSAEDNMKHYGVVSECVCWEGGGECRVC